MLKKITTLLTETHAIILNFPCTDLPESKEKLNLNLNNKRYSVFNLCEQDNIYNQVLHQIHKEIIQDYYADKVVMYNGRYYPVQYLGYYALKAYITPNSYIELSMKTTEVYKKNMYYPVQYLDHY